MSAVESKTQSGEFTSTEITHVEEKGLDLSDGLSDEVKLYQSRGVARMEMVKATIDAPGKRGARMRVLFWIGLLVISWVYTFEAATTSNYSPSATSAFGEHSMLATVDVATSIISAVCPVIIAKIADISSRPQTFGLAILIFTIGCVIASACQGVTSYAVGSVFMSIGSAAIYLLITLLAADVTPLKYRGLLIGLMTTPYLINTWFTGLIVDAILKHNWRWGYGMFCVIVPVTMVPAVVLLIYLEHQAKVSQAALGNIRAPTVRSLNGWMRYLGQQAIEVDLFGLLLLAFGWSLLLLPLSLYSSASNHWKNPSLIAMFVTGGVILFLYVVYELKFAPVPSMPQRMIMNRTFMTSVCLGFFYYISLFLGSVYFSSYVLVIFDWSYTNWTYFNNAFTMSSSFSCVLAGIILRFTHRSKYLQVFALSLQIVAMAIAFWARYENATTVSLVWVQLLLGMGGISNTASQVSSQASVPHQDTALAISLLSLWSTIGSAVGTAIAGAIWQSKLPIALRKRMPASVNDTMIETFYGDITAIYALPFKSEERQAARLAYFDVSYYLFAASLGLSGIPFFVSFLQKNFYLGDTQNAIESTTPIYTHPPKKFLEKLARFFDDPLHYQKDKANWEAMEKTDLGL